MRSERCPTCKGLGTVVRSGPSVYEYDNRWPCPRCTPDRRALRGTGRVSTEKGKP